MVKKVLVALSGGVDSSITAYLLQKQGYEVEGAYMMLHHNRPGYHEHNLANIDRIANFLGIKTHIVDFSNRFDALVFKPFLESYRQGLTPNPCVLCNRNLKFGAFYDFAKELGCDAMATGHYVRNDGQFLYEAICKAKDQSYFLFDIRPNIIPDLLFPLGNWRKDDVKKLAREIGLEALALQKESSEICFVDENYVDTLRPWMEVDQPGEVVDETGRVIGRHKGYVHYTIGKRKGFQVPGAKTPLYVTAIDAAHNRITVAPKEALACRTIDLTEINTFIPETSFTCQVKIRYRTDKVPATVTIHGNQATVHLLEDVYGVAAGQACVFYDDEKVIGGGWISGARPTDRLLEV
ncbi:MAG: tRNA 2-thiouridine(34) synthase MnmA [Campylobacterales bacterium]